MLIDITSENLITLAEAAKLLPGRPHISTVWRFAKRGVRGIQLSTIVSGGRRFTSREAIDRFVAATTAAADSKQPPRRTSTQHDKAIERSHRELREGGFFRQKNDTRG